MSCVLCPTRLAFRRSRRCCSAPACAIPYVSPTPRPCPPATGGSSVKTDRVTGKPISSAFADHDGARTPPLLFRSRRRFSSSCFMDNPVIKFRVPIQGRHQPTTRSSAIASTKSPATRSARHFMASASTVVIEEPAEVAQFVSELATQRRPLYPHPLVQCRTHHRRVQGRWRARPRSPPHSPPARSSRPPPLHRQCATTA